MQGTAICVLGMSRSGTSLTARVLNLAGVYLGPQEDLLGGELRQIPQPDRDNARAANPEGFWEHYPLMRLNERILRRMGGNWREPPPLPPGWEDSAALDEESEEACALIEETFGGHDLWGWKDPRNCLTLPFWQRLLPQLRYVICLRNPLDVAASLQRRDGMPFEDAVELWLTYLARALLDTADHPRLLVPYESYFDDPGGVVSRLAAFVGRDGALDRADAGVTLAEAVDERLWRNRTHPSEVGRDPRVPVEAAALHQLTELLAGAGSLSGPS